MLRSTLSLLLCLCALSVGLTLDAQTSPTRILDRVRVDTRKPIDFHAAAFPETLYVGQQATYQVAVFLNSEARSRLRRNPEFLPPELRGLLAYELGSPTRVPPRDMNGAVYEAHVFQRALFPVAAGPLSVPAPQLSYALPQSSSYFSREEKFIVRAESAQLVVRPIPTEGRPTNFTGAIGVFTATSRLDTAAARVGDPLVFTLRVQGTGNVKLLPRPTIEIDWASAVPGTERVRVDTAGPLVRGSKEFDWILTPSRDGPVVLPAVRYGYFDPYQEKFADAEAPELSLDVRAGALVQSEAGESTTLLPLRARNANASTLRVLVDVVERSPIVAWLLLLLAPLPALLVAIVGAQSARKAARANAPIAATEQLARLASGRDENESAVRSVRRVLHSALAERLQVRPAALVAPRQLRRVLRRRGVTRETTDRVVGLLDAMDAHAFAGAAAVSARDWASESRSLLTAVDAEAVRSGGVIPPDRFGTYTGLALLLLCTSPSLTRTLQAQAPAARDAFAEASQAYERRMFAQATAGFSDLVRASPRDPDLLMNWGTAAWAAGDTVHAVMAWQRAARIDPLDADVQERLLLLPSGARGGLADVPMVPVPLLMLVAATTWLAGWLLLAIAVRQRQRGAEGRYGGLLRSVAVICLVAAALSSGAVWWGRAKLRADGLAVVLRPETLHLAPGNDADALGGVSTGDVVRALESRDGWRHVQHADGRSGWLPEQRVASLLESALLSDNTPR